MSLRRILSSTLIFAVFASGNVSYAETLKLEEVSKRVKERNLSVLQEAEKVYQAKESIDVARGGLLPRLNLWNLLKVVIEPTALLDLVHDIAPFLIPANWFRLKQNELLYQAELEAYAALKGNEVLQVRALFLRILMDKEILNRIEAQYQETLGLIDWARAKSRLGQENSEALLSLESAVLKLDQDRTSLTRVLEQEIRVLTMALGEDFESKTEVASVELPNPKDLVPLKFEKSIEAAISGSPEVRQYDIFIKVLPQIRKEIRFNFLGVSETSRGIGGGIFDNIPIPGGLGFSNGAALRISRSEEKVLQLQRRGVVETLKRELARVVEDYNESLIFSGNVQRRFEISSSRVEQMKFKIRFGQNVSSTELFEALETETLASLEYTELLYRLVLLDDRFARLTLSGEYQP